MMRICYYILLFLSSFLIISCSTVTPIDPINEILFDENSSGWTSHGEAEWTISNGILSAENGLGYAVTINNYENFILEVDFNPDETMNSGIFIRCPEEIKASGCYEINIADNHDNQDFRTGAIVTHGKPLDIVNTINKWSHFKIMAKDDRIGVWVNGIKTADLRDSKSKTGTIAMQVNGDGKIQFNNVVLTRLK